MSTRPATEAPSPELLAFLEAIKETPDDDMPRLILADWFEERGEPRGEFIRAQVLAARLAASDPHCRRLEAQAAELLARHEAVWQGRLPDLLGGWQFFHRGLLHLTVSPGRLMVAEARLLGTEDWCWVEAITLRSLDDGDAALLAGSALLSTLTELSLSMSAIGDDGLVALVTSPHVRHLAVLRLDHTRVGLEGLQALARSEIATRLTTLDLGWTPTGAWGAQALASSSRLRRLKVLQLHGANLGDAGVAELADSPILDRVQTLSLSRNGLTDDAAESLVESAHLGSLRRLHLTHNPSISEHGRRLLLERLPMVQCLFGGR